MPRQMALFYKMAEEDERKPLLLGDDGIKTEFLPPREKVKSLFESDEELEVPEAFRNGNNSGIFINQPTRLPRHTEADVVTCIFVVAFDTRSGNMIEWCIPRDIDLEGIEFKAMPSGSHHLANDFVYFRKDDLFGLACFENMRVQSELERGARMKSVGIMATSYTLLYRHMQFLETQVRHQLETPGNYEKMMAFYEDKKGVLPPSHSVDNLRQLNAGSPGSELLPELRITHPAGCFSQFLNFFGIHIFTLWKFALLKKRILFFSPPPIGVVCYRVYCACCLAMHHMPGINTTDLKPYFYVNVADIDSLENELSYVACTTESIFQHKTGLYDVYVDNQNVTANSPVLKEIISVSSADKDKFTKLNNQRSLNLYRKLESGDGGADEDDEEMFISYFTELNNRLFQTLLDVSMSQDKQLTSEHMDSMGLDSVGDRAFLMELVETYAIDVMLMVDNSCCPR